MNIVTAIRNLPDPPAETRTRKRWLLGAVAIGFGALLILSGIQAKNAITLGFGVSLFLLGAVPVAERLGAPPRIARTTAGLGLVAWFVLPVGRWLFGTLSMDFSIFILSGIMIVVGATWALMYNADLLLGAVTGVFGRIKPLAPVLRMSMAYPLRNRFRTGVTLAMFTLVVFTLVTGATTTTSFVNGMNDMRTYGGGFDVRATVAPTSPITDMRQALQNRRGINPADFSVVSSQSFLPVKAHQVGTPGKSHGLRRTRPRRRLSEPHDLWPSRPRQRLPVGSSSVARNPRSSSPSRRRRRRRLRDAPTGTSAPHSRFNSTGFTSTTSTFIPLQWKCEIRRRAGSCDSP